MTTNKIKLIALYIAKYAGLFAIARRATARKLRILGYHGFEILDEGPVNPLLFMRGESFSKRLDWLKNNNYNVISLDKALADLASGTLAACPVVLTLDDGWYSIFAEGLPALRKHHFPATVYVSTYYMEKQTQVLNIALEYAAMKNPHAPTAEIPDNLSAPEREEMLGDIFKQSGIDKEKVWEARIFRYMDENEVRQLAESEIDVQLHTHRHRISDDPDVIAKEISDNRRSLARCTEQKLVHFCYPSGFYTDQIVAELRSHGIVSAVTCDAGLNDSSTNLLKLHRFLDGDSIPMIVFEAEICGLLDVLRSVRRAVRA